VGKAGGYESNVRVRTSNLTWLVLFLLASLFRLTSKQSLATKKLKKSEEVKFKCVENTVPEQFIVMYSDNSDFLST
jgi:hypothetical protein